MLAFSDLRCATYCPRQLWYARRSDDRSPPDDVVAVKRLAHRYGELLAAPTHPEPAGAIASAPIEIPAAVWQERVEAARERFDRFPDLREPADSEVFLAGRECHGVASKVLPDPPVPSLVSPGKPPENGVWEPQSVWAVAAAKALAWERETRIDAALVEYPAYGEIRRVRLTTRKKALYRKAIRTVESLDSPPPRVADASKCEPCEYAASCGVATRTLRSRLAGR